MKLIQADTPEAVAGIPHLEHAREKLRGHLDEIQRLLAERDFHEARKQEASQRIQEILEEGRRAATALRVVLREHLGPRNEQLAADGNAGRSRSPGIPRKAGMGASRNAPAIPRPSRRPALSPLLPRESRLPSFRRPGNGGKALFPPYSGRF
jgi:hypothetical protein